MAPTGKLDDRDDRLIDDDNNSDEVPAFRPKRAKLDIIFGASTPLKESTVQGCAGLIFTDTEIGRKQDGGERDGSEEKSV
jgi:hypothetical protein